MSYFLDAILPSQGTYFVVAIAGDKVKQRPVGSIDALETAAQGVSDSGANAYFALSTFKDASSRKVTNAEHIKSFFLDIDCGQAKADEGKGYVDAASAAEALNKFVADVGLPTPMVVSSGFGLHVYWPLESEIQVEAWLPVARSFKRLCIDKGLIIDPAVPADAARVLRVPGTKNFKKGEQRDVTILNTCAPISFGAFAKHIPSANTGPDLSAAKRLVAPVNDVGIDLGGDLPKWSFERIAGHSLAGTGCNQIKIAIEEAATLPEPQWRAALSVAWCCTDAETAIQDISRAHPEYTAANTLAKAQATSGAWSCSAYRENYPAGCNGCKHKGNSPLSFGRTFEEAAEIEGGGYEVAHVVMGADELAVPSTITTIIPEYPRPYFRGQDGHVYIRVSDSDGNITEEEVCPYDLRIDARFWDGEENGEDNGELYEIHLRLPHDGLRRFSAPATTLVVKDKMVALLAKYGAITSGKGQDRVMAYLVASMKRIQAEARAALTRNQMGWTPEDTFVIGELEYTKTGTRLAPPSGNTRQMAPLFQPHGTIEEWRKIVDYYDNPGQEPKALAVLLGFGSPLLKLLGNSAISGGLLNLISTESGTGKTTALMVMNSIFGHPSQLLMQQNDTTLAKMQRMGTMNSIAMAIDELTTIEAKEASMLIYGATQGRARHRMESQSNKLRVNNTRWQGLSAATSNKSVLEIIAADKDTADGETRRIIEIYVPRNTDDELITSQLFAAVEMNYGIAGPIYMQYVLANMDKVKQNLKDIQAKLDADLGFRQADRFYSAILTCSIAGGMIAKELGLIGLDIARIYRYLIKLFKEKSADVVSNRVDDISTNVQQAISGYIAENLNGILQINANSVAGMENAPIISPKGPLRIRHEPDVHCLWIPSRELNLYLSARQINIHQAVKWLASNKLIRVWQEKEGVSHTRPKRIAAGALGNMTMPSVRSYCFDARAFGNIPTGDSDAANT